MKPVFGPRKPHWLSQAAHGFQRHQDSSHGQFKLATSNIPPVAIYANAVYYFNQRVFEDELPSSLRLDAISHVFYAFASVGPDGVVALSDMQCDVYLEVDGTRGCLRAFSQLKQSHQHLKLILSIGGGTGGANFAAVAADPDKRVTCASTARSVIDQHGFDGIDIDWEYPMPGQQCLDLIQFLAALRRSLPAPRYLLTMALPAGQWVLSTIDLVQAASHLDFLNLMAYDFTGDWEPRVTGHQAQLRASAGGASSDGAIQYVLSQGFPANKVLLGCPMYGRSFLDCNTINQRFTAVGGNGGTFAFKDLPRPGTAEQIDETAVAAFCVGNDGGFVSYDNPQTVRMKANFVKEHGLGGMFFWHGTADAVDDSRSLVLASYGALHS